MKTFLIAEIGMCHNGSMATAKEMIRVAKSCGASAVKGQAFNAGEINGSMPPKFYADRQLSVLQLMELIQYGQTIGIDVFYSIFSKEFEPLRATQKYQKFSASQSKNAPRWVEQFDKFNVIVSVNPMTRLPDLKKADVLYATSYLTEDPHLKYIKFFSESYGRQVGYSDHCKGISWCVRAKEEFGAHIIEKHFTLSRDIYFEGQQFRDAIHGADPAELEQLARALA